MGWDLFNYFGPLAAVFWITSAVFALRKNKKASMVTSFCGVVAMGIFIAILWQSQGRPPLRTMGETRLWYSFFLGAAGLWTYYRWAYSWFAVFSSLMAIVFIAINLAKPEIHSITLMPALQSPYFVPHVIAYILAYAMMGVATITALIQLRRPAHDPALNHLLDNVVYIGFGFLMLGLLSGAAWAKEAWGHYWSWDPKETWALITAAAYLLNIHLRLQNRFPKLTLTVLPVAFILLMITWLGVSSLPSAQGSIHVYSS
jgi:ABC-type transport system involved in cytochrome c biogenesis permease subunit